MTSAFERLRVVVAIGAAADVKPAADVVRLELAHVAQQQDAQLALGERAHRLEQVSGSLKTLENTKFAKQLEPSELELACQVIKGALDDAGIKPSEVDALSSYTMEASLEFDVPGLAASKVLQCADGRRVWLYRVPFRPRR